MRFEELVTILCAQALAADNDSEVRKILAELRVVLHQHVDQLRKELLVAYRRSLIRSESQNAAQQPGTVQPEGPPRSQDAEVATPRTWQQVVHEIAREKDHGRALQLSQELSRVLQRHAESLGQS